MDIEYDPSKAESNLSKHGVSFEEAASSLLDPEALTQEDIHSEDEARWILIGMSEQSRLLVVVYSLPSNERIRLISARTATNAEANDYAR